MKISVNDCLKLDAFRSSRVLSCPEECARRVRTVSVLDEDDLVMGVKRNGVREQMVITHLWTSRNDVEAQAEAVRALGEKDISALVIFLNEKGITEVDPAVVDAAKAAKLPLLPGQLFPFLLFSAGQRTFICIRHIIIRIVIIPVSHGFSLLSALPRRCRPGHFSAPDQRCLPFPS